MRGSSGGPAPVCCCRRTPLLEPLPSHGILGFDGKQFVDAVKPGCGVSLGRECPCQRQSGPRGCGARCPSDVTGGDKNMRYALVIAMLLGSTLLAPAEPIDRDKWIAQTGKASKSCLAKFRQKFGEDKSGNYSRCVTDQTNKAIDECVGSSEFSNCVLEKSLRVLEVCDLSSC